MTRRSRGRLADAAPAAATGALILFLAAPARLILSADEICVYVFGRPIRSECSFRRRFGLPCPTCGFTRSVALALHGHLLSAWRMAPGGAAATVGTLAFAFALLLLAWLQFSGRPAARPFGSGLREASLAAGALIAIIWIAGWAAAFAAALHHPH